MYLKNLTLRGFKSFASKTELVLEPGITCIVGPNGSGKSNVVDALAWVMGEQGVKTLRGGKMDDVIFAGSDGKSTALGRAEVSLTIDNTDGALPIEYTEVTIKRTMFRGGGSEYEINGESCRLLDIQELLSDSGLGREMHVIVGQGRLDTILNATPLDRRGFIEEAAGVLKHRRRKEKAVRKLDAMQANLTRLTDLAAEVRRQLGPLGRQADIAKRANLIQVQVRDSLSRILADDYIQLETQKTDGSKTIQGVKSEHEKLVNVASLLQDEIIKIEESLTNQQVQEVSEAVYKLESLKQRFESLINLANERVRNYDEPTLLLEGQDPEKLEKLADDTKAKQSEFEKELKALEADLAKAEKAEIAARDQAELLAKKVEIIRQNSSERRESAAKLEAEINAKKNRIQEVTALQKATKDSKKQALEQLELAQKELAKLQKELDGATKEQEKLELALQKAYSALSIKQIEVQELESDKAKLDNSVSSAKATIETLTQMLHTQLGENVKLKSKKVSKTETISELRKIKSALSKVENEVGEDFVVASNQVVANIIAERTADFSVLSLDGELLYHETLGGKKVEIDLEAGSIRERIAIAEQSLKSFNSDITKLEKQITKAGSEVEKLEKEHSGANEAVQNGAQSITKLQSAIQISENDVKSITNDTQRNTNQYNSHTNTIKEQQDALKKLENELKQLETNQNTSSDELQSAIDQSAAAEVALANQREKYQNLATEVAAKRTQNQNLIERAGELNRQAEAESKAREEAKRQEIERQRKSQKAAAVAKISQSVLEKLAVSIEGAKQVRQKIIEQQTASNESLTKMRLDLRSKRQEIEQMAGQIHKFELEFANLDSRIAALTERINIELSVHPRELIKEYAPSIPILIPNEEGPEKPFEKQYVRHEQETILRKAQKDLVALGKVNPLALEEFEAGEERHKYLTDQLQDLEKSRADLLEMIAQIDQRTINTFASAFEDTAKEFEKVFEILFPGGKGRLKLTDPNDLLNTGIEVEATPAGKRISRLSLLSGGERSLVAVAMLVAIFKARPSPFYVMDEVEAALDDVNLSRLLKIFLDLKVSSQILIVTHQKRTMEVADALYGITMRKDGITQVISQKMHKSEDA